MVSEAPSYVQTSDFCRNSLMTKKNLVLILPSLRLYRSIYRTDLVEELRRSYQLNLILSKGEVGSHKIDRINVSTYSESAFLAWWHKLALNVETFRLRNENISYDSRIRMITRLPLHMPLSMSSFLRIRSKHGILLALISSNFGYTLCRPILGYLGSKHVNLEKILKRVAPEVVVCFSGGVYSGIENFIGNFCRNNKAQLFLIIDNWDNLSSKSVIWNKPTLLGVWGPEMEMDALELHKFHKKQIVHLGSSRVDLGDSITALKYSEQRKPYVLFAGSGIHFFDEIDAVIRIRQALNSLGNENLSIIYRPHPWVLRGDFVTQLNALSGLSGIEVDRDILEKGSESFYDQDSLAYLETLVANCFFLIAGHSTVLVEALYHGRKVLALTESHHKLFNTSDSWSLFRHMQRLRGNIGIFECSDISNVEVSLAKILKAEVQSGNLIPSIIPNFQASYATRVISALNDMKKE